MSRNFHQLPELVNRAKEIQAHSIIVQPVIVNELEVARQRLAGERVDDLEPKFALEVWRRFILEADRQNIPVVSPLHEQSFEEPDKDRLGGWESQSRIADTVAPEAEVLLGKVDFPINTHVDQLTHFCGWALDRSQPDKKVRILLQRGETPLAAGMCNKVREDVSRALGVKTNTCGFNFEATIPKAREPVDLVAISGRRKQVLGRFYRVNPADRVRSGLLDYLEGLMNRRSSAMYCWQPWSVINVSREGLVRTCCNNDTVMGNLQFQDFRRIWNDSKFRSFRHDVRRGKVHPQCARCLAVGLNRNAGFSYGPIPSSSGASSLSRGALRRSLAWIIHKFSAAVPESSVLTALRSVGLLDVP